MYKVYEYECHGMGCPEHFKVIEKLLESSRQEEPQLCSLCHRQLVRVMSATRGYVRGSENPVKQK